MIRKIKIFTLGGSIDKTYSMLESDFVVGEPEVKNTFKHANTGFIIEYEEFLRKDSLEISDAEREELRDMIEKDKSKYILITHGTDTIHHTARALSAIRDKVIILTGAMRPAAFRDTDAQFNLGGAVIALQTLADGVYIVMNGKVFNPLNIRKNMETGRFEEKNEREETE